MKPKPLLQKKDCDGESIERTDHAEVSPDPLTLVLLGHTGVGKSASGNTLLRRNAFVSRRAFRSVTLEICEQSGSVGGQQVRVVDTPGIMDAQKEKEVRAFCEELRRSRRPHVFLFVLKIDRFTQEQEEALRSAMNAAGEEGVSRGVLLFTGADSLGDMNLQDFINNDPENPLPALVQEFGGRTHRFHNSLSPEEKPEQVLELMKTIRQMGHGAPPPGLSCGQMLAQTGPDSSQKPRRLEELRLVLLGLPGAGKSSTGNTILGSHQFESCCAFNPVTTESQSGSAEVDGRQVTVVDTPGFLNQNLEPLEVYDQIEGYVEKAGEPGLNGFVIVVPLGRITEADSWLFTLLSLVFDMSQKFFTVLFTHGDELGGMRVEDLVNSNAAVKELVSRCGGRYCVFNNKERRNLRQVQELFRIIDQMNSDNNGQNYTVDVLLNKQNSVMDNPAELEAFRRANGIPQILTDSSNDPDQQTSVRPPVAGPSNRPPVRQTSTRPDGQPRTNRSSNKPPSKTKTSRSFFGSIGHFFRWIYHKICSLFASNNRSQSSSTEPQSLTCKSWLLNMM